MRAVLRVSMTVAVATKTPVQSPAFVLYSGASKGAGHGNVTRIARAENGSDRALITSFKHKP
jgi:hypothetical protein